jgi:cytosine/adenosine deaminase-related metal-dependent hydrolase
MAPDLLFKNSYVVTMDPELGDVPSTDIRVSDGRIEEIGQGLETGDAEVVDAAGLTIIPGLIDTHRHTWQSVLRNSLPDVDLPQYLQTILNTFAPHYRPEDVGASNLLGSYGAINAGVTTMLDWSHIINTPAHADAAIEALQTSGIRAVFAHGAPNKPHAEWWKESVLTHPKDFARVRSQYCSSENQLVSLAMALRGPEFATIDATKADVEFARSLGAPMTMHVGCGGLGPKYRAIEQMHHAGILGPDMTFVHCTTSSDEELKMVVDAGASVSIAPAVESQMGHGDPPFNRFSDLGVRPSLSVDVETSTASDMFTQMRAAYHTSRLIAHERARAGRDAQFLSTRDVLELATMEGARTLGLESKVGSVSVGKRADLVLLDLNRVNVAPVNNVIGAIVLSVDTSNVVSVVIDGVFRKRDGVVVGLDYEAVMETSYRSRDFLYQAAGRRPDQLV